MQVNTFYDLYFLTTCSILNFLHLQYYHKKKKKILKHFNLFKIFKYCVSILHCFFFSGKNNNILNFKGEKRYG